MRLPIYPDPPKAAVEGVEPLDCSRECVRCSLHKTARTVCMLPDGAPGGLLVVGGSPTEADDGRGRPFVSASGDWVRQLLRRRWWNGPIVFDYALKCAAGRDAEDEHIDACRPYLAAVLKEASPTRIICLGERAARGVLGSSPPISSTRKAYSFVGDIPVFLLPEPATVMRNAILRRAFEEDLEWALMETFIPGRHYSRLEYYLVSDEADARVAELALADQRWLSLDVETSGPMYGEDFRLLTVALSDPRGNCYVWDEDALSVPAATAPLLRLLSGGLPKGGQNVKFDMKAIQVALGVEVSPIGWDTRVQRRLLAAEALSSLAVQQWMVGFGGGKDEADDAGKAAATAFKRRVNKVRKAGGELGPEEQRLARCMDISDTRGERTKAWFLSLVEPGLRQRYCALDAVSTAVLQLRHEKELRERPDIARAAQELVIPSIPAYARMEANGIRVNQDKARDLAAVIRSRQAPILERFGSYPILHGKSEDEMRTFMNSPKQKCEFLYDELKLRPPGGRRSSDKEALAALDHPAVADLRAWQELEKLRSTYADGLLPYVGADGRIHPSINVDGTRTGRTSCEEPNLQNIPRARSELSKWCKDIFEAAPGHRLLQLDYSQLELRVACHLSGDPVMESIFASGEDYHQRTGVILHGAGYDPSAWPGASKQAWDTLDPTVQKVYRDTGKTFNFALVFQQGDGALARNLKSDKETAARVRALILGKLRVLQRWMQDTIAQARKDGGVWTFWNGQRARFRELPDIASDNEEYAGHARRAAGNTPIQGSANEFKVASVVAIDRWLREDRIPAKVIVEVHDSILLEVREDALAEVALGARSIMEGWPSAGPGKAALKVDIEAGPAWGSMEKWAP